MTSLTTRFIACGTSNESTQSLESDHAIDFSVVGAPSTQEAWDKHRATILNNVEFDSAHIHILPLGDEGKLIWKDLPQSLSCLVAPPHVAALTIIPRQIVDSCSTQSIWEWLTHNVDVFKVHELTVLDETEAAITYPQLAPSGGTMPTWLESACGSFSLPRETSHADATAIHAGLFQIHDELERSHEYAQDCQGRGRHVAGDYWHGIMHRREPDYGNSKYWFRRVGDHSIFPELAHQANAILKNSRAAASSSWNDRLTASGWDAFTFVDLCEESARGGDPELTRAAEQIQWREMMLLLAQTYRDATE